MPDIKKFFGCFYHIVNHGNKKESLFREEWNYYEFLDLYQRYFKPIVSLYAYCLLPSYFHLLLRIKDQEKVSDLLPDAEMFWYQYHAFLGTYTKRINKAYNRTGALIVGVTSRILKSEDRSIFPLIARIHLCPEDYGIVSDYKLWPFSSYYAYKKKDRRSFLAKDFFFNDLSYSSIMNGENDSYRPINTDDVIH